MQRSALVTGAAGGIGLAVAKQLNADGFFVTGMDLAAPEEAQARLGDGIQYIAGDITRGEDRERALGAATGRTGRLDVLVNVAGVAPRQRVDLLEMTQESFDRVMEINTKGTLFLTQLAARRMLAQAAGEKPCVIVNTSSMSAYTSSVSRGEYCISKAGVSMITTLFADRLAADGILVYEVRPGIIETGMTAGVKGKYDALIADGLLPISRWGTPQDVADCVSVLASGRLGYSTGEVINVDGGFHLRRL